MGEREELMTGLRLSAESGKRAMMAIALLESAGLWHARLVFNLEFEILHVLRSFGGEM